MIAALQAVEMDLADGENKRTVFLWLAHLKIARPSQACRYFFHATVEALRLLEQRLLFSYRG